MAVQERLYTADDLFDMPDDGKIYELHNGVLVEVAGSALKHTGLGVWIAHLLLVFKDEHDLGGIVTGADGTFVFNRYNTRIPDVGYISEERAEQQDTSRFAQGAPDLAIEIVSPSNTPQEMQQKAGEFLSFGTRLVWIVDPVARTVDVYRPGGERTIYRGDMTLDGGDVLPGLNLPLATLFKHVK
jgi:Uma2 family endonuclease